MENKPYIVIARKYRPQGFDAVIGQEAVTTTLKNAIALGRTGHAYLFTGPRGVGKTSMARIFAKALNCKKGPTVDPCGECQACVEIEQGRSLDVMEIDGASNRGIDEIRVLRENVRFAPVAGKFKIYIIDEVHQITHDAFNALLKTLEEPPTYVKFIFATTSAQKVPVTILSRCQRFDFRRIPTTVIAAALKTICQKEKIKIEDEALDVIARAADGSLRDSQSILDQIASASREKINKKDVVFSLGALEEEKLYELTACLAQGQAKEALLILDGILAEGKDPALFLEKFLEHVRNLLFAQLGESLLDLADAGESYKKLLSVQKDSLSREDLFYFFGVIMHTLQIARRFEMKRIPIEMALIKLAHRVPMQSLSEALSRLGTEEKKSPAFEIKPALSSTPSAPAREQASPVLETSVRPLPSSKAPASSLKAEDEEEELPEIEELLSEDIKVMPAFEADNNISLSSIWQALLSSLKTEKISVASYLAEGEPMNVRDGVAQVAFTQKHNFHRETLEMPDNKKLIEKYLSQHLGREARVEFLTVKETSGKPQAGAFSPEQAPPSPQMDNALKSAMNIFGGRVVDR